MHARLSRQLHRLRRNGASVMAVAAVGMMFALALVWLQTHVPSSDSLRAVAGTQR